MMKHYRYGRDADGTPRAYAEQEGCRHPMRQLAGPDSTTWTGVDDGSVEIATWPAAVRVPRPDDMADGRGRVSPAGRHA